MDTHFQTLVLNRLWQAVNVVGVERAFSLLSLEHAQVIYAEDGSFRVLTVQVGSNSPRIWKPVRGAE